MFADATDPVIGNPAGDVTIVEFFDNECPFCKPGLVIGDQVQSGAMTMDALKSAVAEARSRKTALDVNVPR